MTRKLPTLKAAKTQTTLSRIQTTSNHKLQAKASTKFMDSRSCSMNSVSKECSPSITTGLNLTSSATYSKAYLINLAVFQTSKTSISRSEVKPRNWTTADPIKTQAHFISNKCLRPSQPILKSMLLTSQHSTKSWPSCTKTQASGRDTRSTAVQFLMVVLWEMLRIRFIQCSIKTKKASSLSSLAT